MDAEGTPKSPMTQKKAGKLQKLISVKDLAKKDTDILIDGGVVIDSPLNTHTSDELGKELMSIKVFQSIIVNTPKKKKNSEEIEATQRQLSSDAKKVSMKSTFPIELFKDRTLAAEDSPEEILSEILNCTLPTDVANGSAGYETVKNININEQYSKGIVKKKRSTLQVPRRGSTTNY